MPPISDNPPRSHGASPPTPEDAPIALGGHRIVELAGPDATAFAQAQCMSDVAALEAGHWHWSGWLTPKGRLIALFALLKFDADTIWLLLPDADPTDLAQRMQRFVFRSKVAIGVRGDVAVTGHFLPPDDTNGARIAGAPGSDRVSLDFGGDGGPRTLRITRGESAAAPPAAAAHWAAFDLAHGLPRLDAAQAERWTPQQLSLDRLRAYSVKKGCYPGQEIVARTHFLGQAKRGLVLLSAASPLAAGTEVMQDDSALGTVVSVAPQDDRWLALAVLPVERDATRAWHAADVEVRPLPLRDGLAR